MTQAGHESVFQADDWRGTLTNISADVTAVRGYIVDETAELETSAFGDNDRTRIGGLETGAFGIDGHLEDTIDTASFHVLANALGRVLSTTFGPEGSVGGDVRYNCEALLQRFTFNAPVDGLVTFSADFLRDGAITRTTF